MERRVAVRGIIVKNGELFCQCLKADDGTKKDFWCAPGGGLDAGESLHEGLTRELIEETGVAPTIGKLLFIQQYRDEKREYLEFFFNVTNVDDFEEIDLASTTHGDKEIAEYGFIDPTQVNLLPAFLKDIDLASRIQSDTPVEVFTHL